MERSFEGLELTLLRHNPWPIVGIWVAFGLLSLWTAEFTLFLAIASIMQALVLLRSRTPVRVDAYGLTVGTQRWLWSELARVEVTKSGLRWESHDGAQGSLPATVSDDAQELLAPAIEHQLARPQLPRDDAAESAMSGLLQRASGSPGQRLR